MSAPIYLPPRAFVSFVCLGDVPEQCLDCRRKGYYCSRAKGHSGRHAAIGAISGLVYRVWGEDVHAETRAKGRSHAS